MHTLIMFPLKKSNIYFILNFTYFYLKLKKKTFSEGWVSYLDVKMPPFKTVYSHLTNKKKELKIFLEYISAKN
jgi:hypothetical protein